MLLPVLVGDVFYHDGGSAVSATTRLGGDSVFVYDEATIAQIPLRMPFSPFLIVIVLLMRLILVSPRVITTHCVERRLHLHRTSSSELTRRRR